MNNLAETELLTRFIGWIDNHVSRDLPGVESGLTDPALERVAWLRFENENCVCGIKLWDTGSFYLEILSMEKEEPELAEFGEIAEDQNFHTAFGNFISMVKSFGGLEF